MKSSPASVAGFNLTELMVVVAIAGVLATIALPSFKSLSQSQLVKNASMELYASLNLARSEAIKRSSDVTMQTTMNAKNEVSWTITSGTTVIRQKDYIKGVGMNVQNVVNAKVVYQRTGRTLATTAPTFLIDATGVTTPFASCVGITLSGMPRIYKPVNETCPSP
jgi:type IV fimbrial biogenesis protein FimT